MQDFSVTINFEEEINGQVVIDIPTGLELQGDKLREIEDGAIVYSMKGSEGEYLLDFLVNGEKYSKIVIISSQTDYEVPNMVVKDGTVKNIIASNEKRIVMNLFGWQLGWLGTYILFSIAFSIGLRKLFKVY